MSKLDRKELIKKAMEMMGVNQVELSKMMGVEQASVSGWKTGNKTFNDTRLFKLKREFDKKVKDYDKSQELFKPFIDDILGVN